MPVVLIANLINLAKLGLTSWAQIRETHAAGKALYREVEEGRDLTLEEVRASFEANRLSVAEAGDAEDARLARRHPEIR